MEEKQLFKLNDIVRISLGIFSHKVGRIEEVRDRRQTNLLIPKGKGFYYWILGNSWGAEIAQKDIKLI